MNRMTRFLTTALLLGVGISCKKEADVAPPVVCRVQKVDYNDGTTETFQYNADGFITESLTAYLDQAGKPASYGGRYTYNSQGLLERVVPFAGGQAPTQDSYEQFSYTNGALSKIEITEFGKIIYRFDVTTNANKQITGLKGVSFDKTNYPEYTGTHTLDAQGRYVKSEGTDANGVFWRFESSDFDPAVKTDYDSFKGWPVNVISNWYQYGVLTPVNGAGARRKHDFSYGYDDSGNYVGLKKLYDFTYTYKTNSNGYATEVTVNNVAVTPATVVYKTTYTYANCQ